MGKKPTPQTGLADLEQVSKGMDLPANTPPNPHAKYCLLDECQGKPEQVHMKHQKGTLLSDSVS